MKQERKNRLWIWVMLVLSMTGLVSGIPANQFEKGMIIEHVNCMADEHQDYALYLPRDFSPETRWPVLFAFDPGGKTRIPLQLFQRAAETFGMIVVSPNNAKNGPWEPILDAMKATFSDIRNRFSVDSNRIYTAGFSGGARAAAAFPQVVGIKVKGIIACGAGLPSPMKPEQVQPAFYHGVVGLEDFNYKELLKLGQKFDEIGVNHFVEVIDGEHGWPSEEICYRALAGIQIRAMKDGLRSTDAILVGKVFDSNMNRALELEKSGSIYHAVQYYQYIKDLFSSLKNLSLVQDRIEKLQSTKAFKKFAKEETNRNREEWDYIARFVRVFNTIKNYETKGIDLRNIFDDLGIAYLNRQAEKSKDIYRRALARRLLRELELKGNTDGANYMEKGDTSRAIIFSEIAAASDESKARAFYRLARLYSGRGDKGKAFKNLKIAVDNFQKAKYQDFSFLIDEKDLDPIKNEKEYQDLLRKVGLQK